MVVTKTPLTPKLNLVVSVQRNNQFSFVSSCVNLCWQEWTGS